VTDNQVSVVAAVATLVVVTVVIVQHVRSQRAFRRDMDEIHARLMAHHRPPPESGERDDGGVDTVDRGGDA